MGLPFTSPEARKINQEIFETIYFASMSASVDLAKKEGHYQSFPGSPLSEGKFQFNLWQFSDSDLSGRWDWEKLRKSVLKFGARNSLLLAPMPTASTAQIMGNNEAFEPFTSNIYTRRTLSGEFIIVNKYLVKDLINLGLWNEDVKNLIIIHKGSIQNIPHVPDEIKEVYKTVWEIKQKDLIEMSVNAAKLTAAHFHSWKLGLKTGMYYLRTKAAVDAMTGLGIDVSKYQAVPKKEEPQIIKKTIEKPNEELQVLANQTLEDLSCSLDNPDDCIACGS
jgi:ribonucleoside-diphosphate reductase alpha chain